MSPISQMAHQWCTVSRHTRLRPSTLAITCWSDRSWYAPGTHLLRNLDLDAFDRSESLGTVLLFAFSLWVSAIDSKPKANYYKGKSSTTGETVVMPAPCAICELEGCERWAFSDEQVTEDLKHWRALAAWSSNYEYALGSTGEQQPNWRDCAAMQWAHAHYRMNLFAKARKYLSASD